MSQIQLQFCDIYSVTLAAMKELLSRDRREETSGFSFVSGIRIKHLFLTLNLFLNYFCITFLSFDLSLFVGLFLLVFTHSVVRRSEYLFIKLKCLS